ncbi:MAG: twin-arginine translocation signal domain-containing protein [Halobacteria archaeon]|nr:twin-arginine translocation signal domain-containing protein [Halobacteria archaeon]
MNRRSFLKSVGAVTLVAVAGGSGYLIYRHHRLTPEPVESVEFHGQGYDFDEHPMQGRPVQRDAEPVIEVDDARNEVVVEGMHWYGSSSCNKSGFAGIGYDDESNEVRAVVDAERKLRTYIPVPLGCTADLRGTLYRLRVSFTKMPARFVMEERHSTSPGTVTAVVEIDK